MKQATLVEIAESCKVTRGAARHWAIKAGEKISSIKRKLTEARPYHPAVFNEDEIVCIVGAHLEIMGNLTEATLQDPRNNSIGSSQEVDGIPANKTTLALEQKLKIAELIVRLAELSERTRSSMPLDYHLNIAKKRLSGLAANNKYTPALNLLEAPNNEEE